MDSVVELFDCSAVELNELRHLVASEQRKIDVETKYRHSCCMFEMTYALAIEPRRNSSSNPGCEWKNN